jgi:hypothetical protein
MAESKPPEERARFTDQVQRAFAAIFELARTWFVPASATYLGLVVKYVFFLPG